MMKKATLRILMFAVFALFGAIKSDAQTITATAIYYPDNGDTVRLHLIGYHGAVQWQKSYDTLTWTDIAGATNDSLVTLVDTNCYFRAVVSDGTCKPFYSENKKVNTLLLNPKTYIIDSSKVTLISDSTQISNGVYYYVYNDTTTIDTSNIILDPNNSGYLQKVQSSTKYGQTLSIGSKQATIADVIKKIDLNDSLKIIISSSKQAFLNGVPVPFKVIYLADGVKLKGAEKGPGLSISGTELFKGSFGGVNVSCEITDGYINFDPMIKKHYFNSGIFNGGDTKFGLSVGGQLDFAADIQLNCDAPLASINKEKTFFIGIVGPVLIGPIPMFFDLTYAVGFNADLSVSGNITAGGTGSANVEFGATYEESDNPQWNTIWTHPASFYKKPLTWGMNGNANIQVYVKPKISAIIPGGIGPYLEARSYLDLDANINTTPPSWDWTLKGGVDGSVGFDMGFLDKLIPPYNQPLFNWETTIASNNGTFSNYSPVAQFTVTPTTGPTSTVFNFDASGCSDVETPAANLQVRWDWENDGSFDTPYSTTKTATHQYTVAGNYTVNLEVLDGDGNTNFTTQLVKVLNPTQLPTVSTYAATNVTKTTANLHGEVTGLGGSAVSQYGHCWATTTNPTLIDNYSSLGSKTTTGSFISNVTGLLSATKYYCRAYTTNAAGTAYGSQLSFTTLPAITPSVNTTDLVYNITYNSATVDGTISDFSGGSITEHGVCWATTQNPTTANFTALLGPLSTPGSFTSIANSLNPATTYYVRTFAINNAGVSYGNQLSFTTGGMGQPCPVTPTVTDIDGNIYNTVQIGSQCWMRENLNVGIMINGISDQTNNGIIEKYCYNDDPNNCIIYGGLYQWAETVQYLNGATNSTSWNPIPTGNVQGICPTGWHVPTDNEQSTLENYLGGSSVAGGHLKEVGTTHWSSPNTAADNSSGFSALPGGLRHNGGTFEHIGTSGNWWSASEYVTSNAWYRYLNYLNSNVLRTNYNKEYGFSVRCVRD